MKSLGTPERVAHLLAFDFDDTLHHRHDEPAVGRDFFTVVRRLRECRGAIWGINTGRSLPHLLDGLGECGAEFSPDFVITREREIWVPDGAQGWMGLGDWNARCDDDHARVFAEAEQFLLGVRGFVERHTAARWVAELGDPAGVIARDVDEIEAVCAHVDGHGERGENLGYQRNSIYLRFCHRDYHKGSALCEVARWHGLGVQQTFAMGDGHNDLGMLCRTVAGAIACPANAIVEVRERVVEQGGFVSPSKHSRGAVEALEWAFGGI